MEKLTAICHDKVPYIYTYYLPIVKIGKTTENKISLFLK